jgi:hypothetical protein
MAPIVTCALTATLAILLLAPAQVTNSVRPLYSRQYKLYSQHVSLYLICFEVLYKSVYICSTQNVSAACLVLKMRYVTTRLDSVCVSSTTWAVIALFVRWVTSALY